MKTKIVGTGLSGLVGSRIVELLGNEFDFEDISRKTGTDITNKEAVLERIKKSDAPFVLHLAAYTNVDEAEKSRPEDDQPLAEKSKNLAWKITVDGTKNVVAAAEATGKHLIHFSTDMVFPGTKPLPGKYTEEDTTKAVGWYATTKEEAEKVVQQAKIPWTILRIAYPYRANYEKKEYVRIFKWLLEEKREIKAVNDHYFTPTFIDDLADVLRLIFKEKIAGIYHAGGKDIVSPYDVAMKVAQIFSLDKNLISPTTRAEYFAGKAPRAFNLSLSSAKIEKLGVHLKGIEEGLAAVAQQIK